MSAPSLPDEVRANAARIAAGARAVRIDDEALAALDWPAHAPPATSGHGLEGASEEVVASFLLTANAVNFGSGWHPTLAKRPGADGRPLSGSRTIAAGLADRFRAHGPWSPAALRAMRTEEWAATVGQRADHELMALQAQALRELGTFLGKRDALDLVREAGGSAVALATMLASGMALWADVGFYKRAQLLPSDLALAGVAQLRELDALTIFGDNLVPHVLRLAGVLVYSPLLAEHVDAGRLLPPGPWEREIRGCAVHACATLAPRLGLPERELDHLLWERGQSPEHKAVPRHRARSVHY